MPSASPRKKSPMSSPDNKVRLTKAQKETARKILSLPPEKRKRLLELEIQKRGLPVEHEVTPEQRAEMLAAAKTAPKKA